MKQKNPTNCKSYRQPSMKTDADDLIQCLVRGKKNTKSCINKTNLKGRSGVMD